MFCRLRNRLSIPTIRWRAIFYILAVVLATVPGLPATIQRQDFLISGGAGQLHVREVRVAEAKGARWDASIPSSDKTVWRDSAVAEAYVRLTLESDPTSSRRKPPSVRIPIGYLRDLRPITRQAAI
jgi:hypothetical protein